MIEVGLMKKRSRFRRARLTAYAQTSEMHEFIPSLAVKSARALAGFQGLGIPFVRLLNVFSM